MTLIRFLRSQVWQDTVPYFAASLGLFIPTSTVCTTWLSVSLLFAALLGGHRAQDWRFVLKHPVTLSMAMLLGMVLLGATYSIASGEDIRYALRKSFKLLIFLALLPLFVDEKWRLRAYWLLWVSLTLTLILAFFKHQTQCGAILPAWHALPDRPVVFKDSVYQGMLMVCQVFLSGILLQRYWQRPILRCVLGVAAVAATYYLFWVGVGRTGQALFFVLLFWLSLRWFRSRGLLLILVAIPLLLLLLLSTSSKFTERWGEAGNVLSRSQILTQYFPKLRDWDGKTRIYVQGSRSVEERRNLLKHGLQIAMQKPWLGWGTGSFQAAYTSQTQDPQNSSHQNPHNQYLNILVQQGIVGLAAFLILLMTVFSLSWRLPMTDSLVLQVATLIMAVGCLGNSWFTDFTSGYLFIWLASVASAAWNSPLLKRQEREAVLA